MVMSNWADRVHVSVVKVRELCAALAFACLIDLTWLNLELVRDVYILAHLLRQVLGSLDVNSKVQILAD
jgi:hypothetical protein